MFYFKNFCSKLLYQQSKHLFAISRRPQLTTLLELLPKEYNEPKTVCQAIRERRGGELNKLDRMLLHSPAVAEGWNIFFQKLREETMIPAKLREITMCVVAVINKATYEFEAHAPLFKSAGGTIEQIKSIKNAATLEFDRKIFSEIENEFRNVSFLTSVTAFISK